MDGLFCAWQNELSEDGSVTVMLDFFEEQQDGSYQRSSESFTERLFADALIMRLVSANGFELVGRFDEFSEEPVKEDSQRILYVCRRADR